MRILLEGKKKSTHMYYINLQLIFSKLAPKNRILLILLYTSLAHCEYYYILFVNPLQCSCLENPRDGGAWWAAVYGVAQSRTPLKPRSSSSKLLHMLYLTVYMVYSRLLGTHKQCVCVCVLVTQSCPTLCNPMDCSPPGSSVHGILQARTLE